jgi:small-conductance mechanosensitive channel
MDLRGSKMATDTTTPSGDGNVELDSVVGSLTTSLSPIAEYFTTVYQSLMPQLMSLSGAVQLGIIAVIGLVAFVLSGAMRRFVMHIVPATHETSMTRLRALLGRLATPILWVILLWVGAAVLDGLNRPNDLLRVAASLLNAWIVIRLVSSLVRDPFWSRTFATIAWIVAALNILRLLGPTIDLLDGVALTLGETRISLYLIIKAGGLAIVLLWAASTLARLIQGRVSRSRNLTPSVQTLIIQAARLSLLFIALMIALNAIGIDLTVFALFSGAIGVGVGFGLQKIVSNFISGVIILLDRSIKPGDVVEVGDTYGWVASLGARYASVRTRDGTEHLIPNEEFIITRVVNWSHSDQVVRRKLPIGIAYSADVEHAIALVHEALSEVPRVLKDPAPNVHMIAFGDSAINLEARFWIGDPENGTANVASDVLRLVWKKFKESDVEIPFPQRDLHIRSGELPVRLNAAQSAPEVAA